MLLNFLRTFSFLAQEIIASSALDLPFLTFSRFTLSRGFLNLKKELILRGAECLPSFVKLMWIFKVALYLSDSATT